MCYNFANWLCSKEWTEVFRIWHRLTSSLLLFDQVLYFCQHLQYFVWLIFPDEVWRCLNNISSCWCTFLLYPNDLKYECTMLRNKVLLVCLFITFYASACNLNFFYSIKKKSCKIEAPKVRCIIFLYSENYM